MICDGAARSAKHRADPESPPPPRVSRGLKLRTGLRVYLVGHREVPADVFFDEPQSRPGVHVGFTSPRLWITSGLPTILELASLITTSAFTGTDRGLLRSVLGPWSPVPKCEAPGAPISMEEHTSMAPRSRKVRILLFKNLPPFRHNPGLQIPRLRYSPGLAPTTRLNALLNAASDS